MLTKTFQKCLFLKKGQMIRNFFLRFCPFLYIAISKKAFVWCQGRARQRTETWKDIFRIQNLKRSVEKWT